MDNKGRGTFYLITYGNKNTYRFLRGLVKIVDYTRGECDNLEFKPEDVILTMKPTSRQFEAPRGEGYRLNSDEAIELSRNKPLARKLHIENGINTPKTWFDIDEVQVPYIARPGYHKQGKNFHVVRTWEEHLDFKNTVEYDKSWYYSELIDVKKEVRIIFLGDEIVYIYEFPVFETPEETVSRRHRIMGTSEDPGYDEYRDLTQSQINMAKRAMDVIGLGYGTADLMFDRDGKCYITEINYYPNPRDYIRPKLREAIRRYKTRRGLN